MPYFYVDLDNNKLITGSSSTQIAATPSLYQGDKPTLELELITRASGSMAQYTSAASAINVRIGALGSSSVASVLSLSVVTLSASASATVGITSPVTATALATMLGSLRATATAGVNNPSVITITPSVTTFANAQAVAYLGPQAIAPVIYMARNPTGDRYLDVREAGTPYNSSAIVYANATSVAQDLSYLETAAILVPESWTTVPSVTHALIYQLGGSIDYSVIPNFVVSGNNVQAATSVSFLTTNGTWIDSTAVTALSLINVKDRYSFNVPYGPNYLHSPNGATTGSINVAPGGSFPAVGYNVFRNPESANNYGMIVLKSGQINTALTASFPYTFLGINVSTLGINFGIPLIYTQTLGQEASGLPVAGSYVKNYSGWDATTAGLLEYLNTENNNWNGLMELRTCASASRPDVALGLSYPVTVASKGIFAGQDITIQFEIMPDGNKMVSGGQVVIPNYKHWPAYAGNKNVPVFLDPARAYIGRRVQTIEIPSCGSQYVTAPSIMLSEPEDENGTVAKATAEINNGKLSKITITDPGTGYSSAPDVFVLPPVSAMKYGAVRSVTSVMTVMDRRLVLAMASGTTISENSWAVLDGLGNANGLAYVVTVATGGSQTTLKFPYDLGTVISVGTATLTPLISYVRVTGANISGTDANFAVGSTIPVTFSTPSCSDTDAVANFTVLNSGQIALSSIPTAGSATTFSVVTLSAYKKITGITVTCAGSGYWTDIPGITIDNAAYVPTAPGATPASITAILNGSGGISLTVVCAGYGYVSAPTVTIDVPNAGNGIRTVAVVTSGVGYTDGTFACTVSTAPSGGATAIVNYVKDATSQSFTIVNPGSGYTSVPTITVPTPDLGGQISAFTVTCKGLGYLVAPAITFTGGGGTGAAAEATIDNGSITTISITTGGTGYTSAPAATIDSAPSSVYYKKQIDLSVASVTTLLAGGSSASAYLQIEEKSGADTTVLAQIPITIQARIS